MKIFDSHAHYDDARFQNEYEGGQSAVLSHVLSGGVARIVNIGTNIATSKECIALSEKYDEIYAACGIYPGECGKTGGLDSEIAALRPLLTEKKVKAIGEIGLDFHYDSPPREVQTEYFEAQLELAKELDMPVCIHCRDASGPCFDILKAHNITRGVMHSFSGSAETARQLVSMGWYISFSGVVTFKNAARTVDAAKSVPIERILVETDCPYLTPHPHRGELNNSLYLKYTIAKIAELHGISEEEAAQITYDNACRFYGIE